MRVKKLVKKTAHLLAHTSVRTEARRKEKDLLKNEPSPVIWKICADFWRWGNGGWCRAAARFVVNKPCGNMLASIHLAASDHVCVDADGRCFRGFVLERGHGGFFTCSMRGALSSTEDIKNLLGTLSGVSVAATCNFFASCGGTFDPRPKFFEATYAAIVAGEDHPPTCGWKPSARRCRPSFFSDEDREMILKTSNRVHGERISDSLRRCR